MENRKTKRLLAGALGLASLITMNACNKNLTNGGYDNEIVSTSFVDNTNEISTTQSTTVSDVDIATYKNKPDECYVDEHTTAKYTLPSIKYEDDTTTQSYAEKEELLLCTDDNFMISDELSSKINKTIRNFGKNRISFDVYDIETGNSFYYNLDETFNGACIVKPSVVMYLCKLADNGLIDLNEKLTYEGDVTGGSGYLNGYYNGYYASYGQKFTILELMYHTLYYSDNNAYRLLHHYLVNSSYYDGYVSYMDSIDANSLKVSKDIIWVRKAQAKDGVNVMKDLYNMKDECVNTFNVDEVFVDGNSISKIAGKSELSYGEIPYYIMKDGKYDYIEKQTGNVSITKTGFVSGDGSLSCRNLVSISYGKRTFLICLLTKGNNEDLRKSTVNKILSLLNDVVNEYDDYTKENNMVLVKSMYD